MSMAMKEIALDNCAEMGGRLNHDLKVARALDRRERIPFSGMVAILKILKLAKAPRKTA